MDIYNLKCIRLQFDFFFFGNCLQSSVSIVDQVKGKMQLMVQAHPEGKANKGKKKGKEEEKEA